MSVPDGDFELDNGSWSLNDRASIQSVVVNTGENSLELRTTSDFDGSNVKQGSAVATLTEVVGVPTAVTFWINPDSAWVTAGGQIALRLRISTSGNPVVYDVTETIPAQLGDSISDGWQKRVSANFTPTSTAPLLRFETILSGSLTEGIASEWYVDTTSSERMAIKLSERAVDALVATLKANLATELTAIDTERGDGLTMTAPAATGYYKYPKIPIMGERAQVEVYEAAGFEFSHDYTDHQNNRATYTVPLTVRLTWFNQNVETVDKMYKRMRRYASGIKIVLVKNPTLEDNDDSIAVARCSSFSAHHETEGEDSDKVVKGVVEMAVEVDCGEVA